MLFLKILRYTKQGVLQVFVRLQRESVHSPDVVPELNPVPDHAGAADLAFGLALLKPAGQGKEVDTKCRSFYLHANFIYFLYENEA